MHYSSDAVVYHSNKEQLLVPHVDNLLPLRVAPPHLSGQYNTAHCHGLACTYTHGNIYQGTLIFMYNYYV